MNQDFINSINMSLVRHKQPKRSAEEIKQACIKLEIKPELPISKDDRDRLVQHFTGSNLATSSTNDDLVINQAMLNALPKPASYSINKEKIVLQEAELLNISLSVEDAKVIASQIIAQSSDIQELIAEIKQALHAYIEHVKQSNTKEINQTITDVYAHANQANREVSDLFSAQCQNLALQMEESRNHFKSSVRDFIKVFAIPQN